MYMSCFFSCFEFRFRFSSSRLELNNFKMYQLKEACTADLSQNAEPTLYLVSHSKTRYTDKKRAPSHWPRLSKALKRLPLGQWQTLRAWFGPRLDQVENGITAFLFRSAVHRVRWLYCTLFQSNIHIQYTVYRYNKLNTIKNSV